ncbi:MAG: hypothetical protein ACLR06_17080 [Christensenellaceae bacterium]
MKIGVVGNSVKIRDETVVGRFLRFLQTEGYEAVLFEKAEDIGGVDALVVLGGDGAIPACGDGSRAEEYKAYRNQLRKPGIFDRV